MEPGPLTPPTPTGAPLISAQGLTIAHPNGAIALENFTLDVAPRELLGIVGPSGCGKTTFLDAIAGFIPVAQGSLLFRGQPIRGVNSNGVGYLFQKDSLMPWRTAMANVSAALELRRVPAPERRDRAAGLLTKVGLGRFMDRYPDQLSGGMRRRVQLATLLAYDPEVILMDEPFGSLDAQTRKILEDDFLRLWGEARKTVVFVTHDLEEAICLCDRVVIMSAHPGSVRQVLDIPLPRPRTVDEAKFAPEFAGTLKSLLASLSTELGKALEQ